MESELRPREIQDRIRGGESAETVAEQAGVTLDRIQAFAAPVLAERAHVATLALASSVRRRGEPLAGRTLRELVAEQVRGHGRDVESLEWDAWRSEDRQWRLQARLPAEGEDGSERLARFRFDLKARFSAAENDDARWLLAELSSRTRGSRADGDPDTEPTEDLEDELALVRALSGDQPLTRSRQTPAEPGREDSGPIWRPGAPRDDSGRLLRLPPAGSTPSAAPAARTAPPDPDPSPAPRTDDDPYDIIPSDHSDLDVLYEMLGGLNEDSVNIYAGLTGPDPDSEPSPPAAKPPTARQRKRKRRRSEPPAAEGPAPSVPPVVGDAPPIGTEQPAAGVGDLEQPSLLDAGADGLLSGTASAPPDGEGSPGAVDEGSSGAVGDDAAITVGPTDPTEPLLERSAPARPAPEVTTTAPASPEQTSPEQTSPEQTTHEQTTPEQTSPEQTTPEQTGRGGSDTPAVGPEPAGTPGNRPTSAQPEVQAPAEEQPATPPAKKGGRKKRASVPSWDEIMFGGPRS